MRTPSLILAERAVALLSRLRSISSVTSARHLSLTEHQLVAVTLWIAHTFVFSRFSITPRLVFESPVRGRVPTT